MTIVSVLHTHPLSTADTVPANCPPNMAGQRGGLGPRPNDWNSVRWEIDYLNANFKNDTGSDLFSPIYQPVVVEPGHFWLLNPRGTVPWVTKVIGTDTVQTPDSVVVGDNLQGRQRAQPIASNSCSVPVSQTPTFVR